MNKLFVVALCALNFSANVGVSRASPPPISPGLFEPETAYSSYIGRAYSDQVFFAYTPPTWYTL